MYLHSVLHEGPEKLDPSDDGSQGNPSRRGAHNLDSGGDRWDVFPQLTVWPNAEPAVSSDGDSGGQCGSTVGFTDSEIDVRHTPHV